MPGSVRTGPKTGHGLTAATAAIGVIVCLLGAAGPAAADNLVSNRAQSATPATDDLKLDNNDVFQKFTTGTNASGYCVESISIEFAVGSASSRDPVYVYLQTDNGAGRPNLPGGGPSHEAHEERVQLGAAAHRPQPILGANGTPGGKPVVSTPLTRGIPCSQYRLLGVHVGGNE